MTTKIELNRLDEAIKEGDMAIAWGMPDNESIELSDYEFISVIRNLMYFVRKYRDSLPEFKETSRDI